MSAKVRPTHACTDCGSVVPKWVGRCPHCKAWGTIQEAAPTPAAVAAITAGPVSSPALPIADISVEAAKAEPSGVPELDRVLGGGLVSGAVILLAGEPGVGKSTLLLEAANAYASAGSGRALIITGEESAAQVRLRAERTGAMSPDLYLAAETDLSAVLSHIDTVQPRLLVVDSVQTMLSGSADGSAGGVTQIRAVTAALTSVAKARGIATVLVGHVTKDGGIAGPRVLEHLVDVVLHFSGDRHSTLRLIRAEKNRYGPADEVGCFEMHEGGIRGLADPSGLFIARHEQPVSGTCVTVTLEGRRPLLAEVQALVSRSNLPSPRRGVSGLDHARIAMILAVVERRAKVSLSDRDVYAATVGGHRVAEPAADLAVAMAVLSASQDQPLPADTVVIGEVGLSGDIRRVSGVGRRLAEAYRLGFARALVPVGSEPGPSGMRTQEIADMSAAILTIRNSAQPRQPADKQKRPHLQPVGPNG